MIFSNLTNSIIFQRGWSWNHQLVEVAFMKLLPPKIRTSYFHIYISIYLHYHIGNMVSIVSIYFQEYFSISLSHQGNNNPRIHQKWTKRRIESEDFEGKPHGWPCRAVYGGYHGWPFKRCLRKNDDQLVYGWLVFKKMVTIYSLSMFISWSSVFSHQTNPWCFWPFNIAGSRDHWDPWNPSSGATGIYWARCPKYSLVGWKKRGFFRFI